MHKFEHVQHLFTTNYSLTYLIWTIMSSTKTIESTPEMITSSDVIWSHVCFNIMNTNDFKAKWLVTWLDVILGANPVLSSFWLAPEWTNFSKNSGRNLPFWRALIQLRSDVRRYVNSLQPFSSKDRSKPVQYQWALFVSRIMFSLLFSLLTFLFDNILFIIYPKFSSDVN